MSEEQKTESGEQERYLALREKNKRLKRRMILVILCILGALAVLSLTVVLAEHLTSGSEEEAENIHFFPPYAGDIFENEDYLKRNRAVSYCGDPNGYGVTSSVTDSNRGDFSAEVLFLCDLFDRIAHGDADGFNAMVSEDYIRKNGRQAEFHQQMIYNITVYFQSAATAQNGNRLITYRLEYCIHRNNGSFRRDVESDAIRPQYAVLNISPDGTILLEDLFVQKTKK